MVFGLNGSTCSEDCAEGCAEGSGSTEDWAFGDDLGDGFGGLGDALSGGLGSSTSPGGTIGSDTSASTTTTFFLRGALSFAPSGLPRLLGAGFCSGLTSSAGFAGSSAGPSAGSVFSGFVSDFPAFLY
jgi:hypothetical protein